MIGVATNRLVAGLPFGSSQNAAPATQEKTTVSNDGAPKRVAIIGAGFISHIHAEVLGSFRNTRVTAVVDPVRSAARGFAQRWGVTGVYSTVDELLAEAKIDCAHAVVPPDQHEKVGVRLLEAGIPVFIEKPMAPTVAGCDALIAAAAASGALLGVNQNQIYHPAFQRLLSAVRSARFGPPRFVSCIYRVPLRQLAAGQFGHWMFDAPVNLLLEQAVHPLSQIAALAGPMENVSAIAGRPIEIGPGRPFYSTVDVSLGCRDLPCQLHFSVGQSFPFWQVTVACEDGVLVADMVADELISRGRTRWLEPVDLAVSGTRTAAQSVRQSWGNSLRYVASATGLQRRSDPFFLGMADGIKAFYRALDRQVAPQTDGAFARGLVHACERIAAQAMERPGEVAAPAERSRIVQKWDVAVIGGTGFIGSRVVQRFLDAGWRVSVMARNTRNLAPPFNDDGVTVHRGDIGDAETVAKAIAGAPVVINLAHGGGGGSAGEIASRMANGAETVARACLAQQSRLLIHIGSIASLYLGSRSQKLTGGTPPDPLYERRGDYARAKAITDRLLLEMAERERLPLCLLRPGVVVGAGATPFHSGFGFYNNEQHCLGWNRGYNPLPLVLVDDVAEAIWLASQSDAPVAGRSFNLIGDVRPTAREFIAMLAEAQGRPLRFHPQWPTLLWLTETAKWAIKRCAGRNATRPFRRDILSRGMGAAFDCRDVKEALGWNPVASDAAFRRDAILVHRR